MGKLKDCLTLKNGKCKLILLLLLIANLVGLFFIIQKENKTNREIAEMEFIDSLGNYNKVYYEGKISDLKKKNRELYDSLKDSKDKISYLVQFTANHEYSTGKVYITKHVTDTVYKEVEQEETEALTYEYSGEPNDTMNYKLKINSDKEPNWYQIDMRVSNKYTIVNKDYGDGLNHVTIGGNNNAEIDNVTVFKKKEKKSPFRKFAIGPSISYGYDVQHGKFGPTVGIGITYNVFGK